MGMATSTVDTEKADAEEARTPEVYKEEADTEGTDVDRATGGVCGVTQSLPVPVTICLFGIVLRP